MRIICTSVFLLLVAAGYGLSGQRPEAGPDARPHGIPGAMRPRAGRLPPIALIERLNRMPPGQRERFLSRLPAERRARLERHLERYNRLSPEEQARLNERYERFRNLPLDKQDELRGAAQQFRGLPLVRRRAVQREFVHLQRMTESERQARLKSQEFRNAYSQDEQQLIEHLTDAWTGQQ